VRNVAERGPLATVGSGPSPTFKTKFGNESVSGCGFLYRLTKTRNHRKTTVQKHPKNAKKQFTENQKNTEYRNITKMETQFLHLVCQGEVCTLVSLPPSVTPLL